MAAEEIVVQTSDIDVLTEALNTAYHKSLAEDHTEAYRNLSPDTSNPDYYKSPLTLLLENALLKAQAITELANDDETSESDEASEEK